MLYFDHAATTPMREITKQTWLEMSSHYNPAGQYGLGRRARSVLDDAREQVAALLGCEPIEVIFTSSGTEADNIAIRGLYHSRASYQRVITTSIEHAAVYETANSLRAFGADVQFLPVTDNGIVHDPAGLLSQPAAVMSCMWANNETGALQPLEEIIAAATVTGTPVHVDAVQVAGKLAIDFAALGATTLAISGHKFGGPRGVGVLIAKRSPAPAAVLTGGGQERGIRPGTVDVAGAAAFAAALAEADTQREAEQARLGQLKELLRSTILATIDDVRINTPEHSLATHLNVSFPGCEGDSLIMLLDSFGFATATGSACANGVNRASRVLLAQGVPEAVARGTLRLTMGYTTTQADVEKLVEVLPKAVALARQAGMASHTL